MDVVGSISGLCRQFIRVIRGIRGYSAIGNLRI
jgi:hypothetical protein